MKKLIIPVLLLLLVFSCKKKDKKLYPAYYGQWSLIHFTENNHEETYNTGDIIWDFNEYDELVISVNTDLSNSQLPITTSGIYDFVGASEIVSIQNTQYAAKVEQDTLTLSRNAAAGGPVIKFLKSTIEANSL